LRNCAPARLRGEDHRAGSRSRSSDEGARRRGDSYLVERFYRAADLAERLSAGAVVHALRHTFATRLAEDGATATEIQALLGHESLNTSQGYIDATANATRQAARANRTYRVLERITPAKQPTNRAC
jgi:integrase/recombinase XerD